MGRKSTFEADAIMSAVGAEVVNTGKFTLERLSEATGISSGSVYHRFVSREALLAQTWLSALRAFQQDFIGATRSGVGPDAIERVALVTPRFCRTNPSAARVLACCRKEEFVGSHTPSSTAAAIVAANEEVANALRRFARSIDRPLLACRLAFVAYPLSAVRLFLPHRPVPKSLDREILKASRAALR